MKKAEAISILATSVRPREAKDRARYDEAVKMAIEALKCSETPKSSERTSETAQADHIADTGKKVCVDTISRQAAIDCVTYDVEHTIECLKALPSAQETHEERTETHACDLIDRQAALDAIMGQPPEPHYPSWYVAQIEKLPAAQPEIIRCKDCKYWRDDHTCHEHSLVSPMCANEYCSRAERRTDE